MLLVEDKALCRAYRQGSRDAIDTIWRHYHDEVYRYLSAPRFFRNEGQQLAFKGYGSAFAREDAVVETFIRAMGKSARMSYDGVRPFSGFLMRIASRVVFDQFRRSKHELESLTEETLTLERVDRSYLAESEQRTSNQIHTQILIEKFLSKQPKSIQQIYKYRYVQELSLKNTAIILSTTEHNVRELEKRLFQNLIYHITGSNEREFQPLTITSLFNGV